jgi:hypothetical protein
MKKVVSLWIMIMLSISAVEAVDKSHLGQKIEDHIMLTSDPFEPGEGPCGAMALQDIAFFQVFPNGTRSESPFQLASGKLLVITDVEWGVQGTLFGGDLLPGRTLRLLISVGNQIVFQSALTLDADSAAGRPGKSEYLTTGFVVGPGVPMCAFASEVTKTGSITAGINLLLLRGYVIAE